jgi:glucokinase
MFHDAGPAGTTAVTTERFLIADIGATNARFVLADGKGFTSEVVRFPTIDHTDVQSLLTAARAALAFEALDGCCVAMAGPVQGGRGAMTNGRIRLDAEDLGARLGCPATVVNDFFALAQAVPGFKHLQQVGGDQSASGIKAVLGPGSGLGMSLLIPAGRTARDLIVLPSEGGHGDLAPGSPLEYEVMQILGTELTHVSWESVLSGPGLVNLYRALCTIWGVQPEAVSAEWISATGVNIDEPICHQVLELFFGFLGSAAGNLALTVCAEGGIYIGGGIVPALADFAATSPMRRRFEERGVLADYAARIPIYIILDNDPGLLGALACNVSGSAPGA